MNKKGVAIFFLTLGMLTSCSSPFQLITGNIITGGGVFSSKIKPLFAENSAAHLQLISIEMFGEYGDATLIDFGDVEILIDSGPQESKAHLNTVLTQYVTDHCLEMLVVTHAHSDHLGAIDDIGFSSINHINYIVDYGYQGASSVAQAYEEERALMINQGAIYYPISLAIQERPFWLLTTSLSLEFLNTNYYLTPDDMVGTEGDNQHSIATLISYGNWRIFLAGDLETSGERYLADHYNKRINASQHVIMKANHHGGLTNNNGLELFDWLQPDYIYISAALKDINLHNSTYSPQHPEAAFVRRALSYTAQVYWNAINGDLTFDLTKQSLNFISGAIRHQLYRINYQIIDPVSEKDSLLTASSWYQAYLNG